MNFDRRAWNMVSPVSSIHRWTVLTGLVVLISYVLARIAHALTIPPDHASLFWPTTSVLVVLMVLLPRRTWPLLVAAGLGGTALGDLHVGIPAASIVRFLLADSVAVLVVMLGIERFLPGLPRLRSLKTFGKFALITAIAASTSAFIGANAGTNGDYWLQWSLWFFSNSLAFVTVAPAIVTWVRERGELTPKPRNDFELAALLSLVVLIGWLIFIRPERLESAALVYSLVPVLLWATLRLGLKGISLSLILISFFSIWGAAHGRGPFAGHGSSNSLLSLQLFLFLAAAPFITLALIVEEQSRDRQALSNEQDQLRESERLAKVGSWWWDPKTDIVTWSDELYRIVGRDAHSPALSYMEHQGLFTPESWERLRTAVEEALLTGTPYELELEMVRSDGTPLWLIARGEAQRDTVGRTVQLRGTVQDITEHKRMEEARFRHAAILESSDDAIISTDLAGTISSWNAGAQRMFGYTEDEVVGTPVAIVIPLELRDEGDEILRRLREGERIEHYETSRVAKDGKRIDVSINISPLRNAGGVLIGSSRMARDITERKRAAAALRESEERLREALQLGKMYAIDWDVASDVVIRSDEATRIYDLPGESSLPSHRQMLERVHPEDKARCISSIAELTPEHPNSQIRFRVSRPDGSVLWLERTGHAFFDEQGKMVRMIGIVADVTERKQFENSLLWRLKFEGLLSDLSRTFINLPEEEIDANVERSLARVGEFLEMDRITLFEFSRDRKEIVAAYAWAAAGVAKVPTTMAAVDLPWWSSRLSRGEESRITQLDDMPAEASGEKEFLRKSGVVSAASIPLKVGGEVNGAIAFVTVRRQVMWTEDLRNQLRIIADIFWNALKRKQAMETLRGAQANVRNSEERFRLAMNNVASGVHTLDRQGVVTYVNPAAEAMLGWTSAELLGKKMHDVTHYKHPDGTPFPASECPGLQVLQTGTGLREHEDMFIRKDGSFFPVVWSASPLKTGGETVGIVVGFRDDTLRREAEQAVRESEERFRLVANTAPVMIWMSGVDKQCTYFNRRWLEFTGRPLEAELGSGWTEAVHPEDLQRCLDTHRKAFDQREPYDTEYRLRRHDGEYRWTLNHGVPRYNADGSFAGYIGSCIDVTERKLAEEALSTLSEQLRDRVWELDESRRIVELRTFELQKLSAELLHVQDEERRRLARDLHDDLGQQLVVLKMNLSDGTRNEQFLKDLDAAIATVRNLSYLLHPPLLDEVGLGAALHWYIDGLKKRSGIDISLTIEPQVFPRLTGDIETTIFRIVQESLTNIYRHSKSESAWVEIDKQTDWVTVRVRDYGKGLPEHTLSGPGVKLGVGISGMRERARQLGGQLTVSAAEPGTLVEAKIPVFSPIPMTTTPTVLA